MDTIKRFFGLLAVGAVLFSGGVYLFGAHRDSETKHEVLKLGKVELPQAALTDVRRISPPNFARAVEMAEETEGTANMAETAALAPSLEHPKPSEIELSHREMAGKLRSILAQEHKDPNWSADTEKKLTVLFSKKLPEGSLVSYLECGSSMCLVELQQKTAAQFRQFMRDALINSRSSGDDAKSWGAARGFITNSSDSGGVSAFVALARDGNDFPSLTE
jgi:hypothetical protein